MIPVVRTYGNTHDRHENVAASSVARSSPPTWHALSRKDHTRVPWQETVLHPSEKLNSDCSGCLPVESCVSDRERSSVFRCCCRNHLSSVVINTTPNDCPVFSEDLVHRAETLAAHHNPCWDIAGILDSKQSVLAFDKQPSCVSQSITCCVTLQSVDLSCKSLSSSEYCRRPHCTRRCSTIYSALFGYDCESSMSAPGLIQVYIKKTFDTGLGQEVA